MIRIKILKLFILNDIDEREEWVKRKKKIRKREGIFNNLKGKKGKVKIKNKVYID